MHRPKAADHPTAKKNLGGKLSALALREGHLLTTDVETVTQEVDLPRGSGRYTAELRVTGPLAFLAAKADALQHREKHKDAYDIVWLVESWPGGPRHAAVAFAARPAYAEPAARDGLARVADLFSRPDKIGPVGYARFLTDEPDADPAQLRWRAVGAITEFTDALPG
jgi:hypothetical protein